VGWVKIGNLVHRMTIASPSLQIFHTTELTGFQFLSRPVYKIIKSTAISHITQKCATQP